MSVQIIVSTPYHYYKHWLVCKMTHYQTFKFYRAMNRIPEINLRLNFKDNEYYCEDMWASLDLELWKWLGEKHPDIEKATEDIYLPIEFDGIKEVRLKNYIEDSIYKVAPSSRLLTNIKLIEEVIHKEGEVKFLEATVLYKEAAEASIKFNQPIFFSY